MPKPLRSYWCIEEFISIDTRGSPLRLTNARTSKGTKLAISRLKSLTKGFGFVFCIFVLFCLFWSFKIFIILEFVFGISSNLVDLVNILDF